MELVNKQPQLLTSVTTNAITLPTFEEIVTDTGKNVTITYPSGCGSTYTCTYSKDGGSYVTVTASTAIVAFTEQWNFSRQSK